MSDLAVKMPFARCNKTNKVISILDAQRGNQCDCQCLSCGTPVTARQAGINQWHFSHRTDENSTASECSFSPVTAMALIVRQQLPQLQAAELEGISLEKASFETDISKYGQTIHALICEPDTLRSIAIEIPFANDKGLDVDALSEYVDFVLGVSTRSLATALYCNGKPTLLRPEEVFDKLLENWGEWVTVLYPLDPEETKEHHDAYYADSSGQETVDVHVAPSALCACCNVKTGSFGKGLLCSTCVYKHVGSTFPNLTEMIRHYR